MGSHFRIGVAVVVSAVILGGAFVLRSGPTEENDAAAVVAKSDHRVYQNTKDTDGDGMRDWEEKLRGTNPLVADKPKETNTQPPTIRTQTGSSTELSNAQTAQFARSFFREYIESGGEGMSQTQKNTFIAREVASLVDTTRDDSYTRADISVSNENTLTSWRAYGNTAGEIINRHSINNESEMLILERALENDDREELAKLLPIIDAYEGMVTDLLRVSAPTELANEHLDLINTLNALRVDIQAMYDSFDDPLPAMVRVKRYQDDADGLYYAINNIRQALEDRGVTYASNEHGIFFFSFR